MKIYIIYRSKMSIDEFNSILEHNVKLKLKGKLNEPKIWSATNENKIKARQTKQ